MTEHEWLTTTTAPMRMLKKVRTGSGRKRMLVACGVCRLLELHVNVPMARNAISAAEKSVEGRESDELPAIQANFQKWLGSRSVALAVIDGELDVKDAMTVPDANAALAAWFALWSANPVHFAATLRHAESCVRLELSELRETELRSRAAIRKHRADVCHVFREVYGNPFSTRPHFDVPGSGLAIACAIRTEANFSLMPILADALDDAGCPDEELVAHCREPRQHRPGCWALDAVLGLK